MRRIPTWRSPNGGQRVVARVYDHHDGFLLLFVLNSVFVCVRVSYAFLFFVCCIVLFCVALTFIFCYYEYCMRPLFVYVCLTCFIMCCCCVYVFVLLLNLCRLLLLTPYESCVSVLLFFMFCVFINFSLFF